jgi:hypothetical protein
MKCNHNFMRLLIVLINYGVCISCILLFIPDKPYLFIAALTTIILIAGLITTKGNTTYRAIIFNLLVITVFLGLVEAYYAGFIIDQPSVVIEGTYKSKHKEYICPDDIRGYRTQKNFTVDSQCYKNNQLMYNVRYSTNALGLRITPKDLLPGKYPLSQKHQNIVFFGCSYTYGEGVQDNQTTPYLVEERSKGKLRSYNLACHGYGPHQMLRIMETGMLDTIIPDKKPTIAVYQGIMAHINRCSGNYPYITWGWNDPRYLLERGGNVAYSGTFSNSWNSKILHNFAFASLNKSYLFHQLITPHLLGWKITKNDQRLYIKIIERSKQLFEEKYNGQFYVLFWPQSTDDCCQLLQELKSRQIKIITTSEIFFSYNEPSGKYYLADSHPSPMAHARIADYIVNRFSPPDKTKQD